MNNHNKQRPPKMPRYDNTAAGPSNASSTSTLTSGTSGDDVWGDEEEDDFLFYATQMAEKQEGICGTNKPSPLQNRDFNDVSTLMMENSEITPAENLILRRQRLEDNSRCLTDNFSGVLGGDRKLEDSVKALEQQVENLKNENYRLKGEASMVRKQMAETKIESSQTVTQMVILKSQMKDQKSNLEKDYKKELEILKSKIQDYEMQLTKFKISPSRPFGRKSNSSNANTSINPDSYMEPMSQPSVKFGTAPTTTTDFVNKSGDKSKPLVITREMQTDAMVVEAVVSRNENIKSKHEIRVALEDDDLMERLSPAELREDIFRTIDKMVQLRYQMVLPTLESVVKKAPKEIMKRLVRGCDIKSSFPDLIDSMFQWGIDKERKRIRSTSGILEPRSPILPFQYEPGVHFHEIKMGIEIRFQYGGIWGALMEVREWLQQVLKSLEGEGRFRLYERNTLMNFWRLLFWANELWRCIVFEEENQELVEKNKSFWAKELEGWTGLVLKCDWRDYFVIELEVLVRKLTLNILESIVTAGYFEPKQNRYVILYRIFKDVLTKDVFRDATNVQHILKIITWSVSDVMIMKHLCYKNNDSGSCLARLIGDNVLKLCRQERDPMTIAVLYIDYLYLLETLILENPISYHHSRVARLARNSDDISDEPQENLQAFHNPEDESMMDCDFPQTQFACPVKYNIEPAEVQNDTAIEELREDLRCWLEPKKYEDPFGRLKLCQCRKILVGSAIFILHKIIVLWRKKCIEYEKDVESLERDEQAEMDSLEVLLATVQETSSTATLSGEEERMMSIHKQRLKTLRNKTAFLSEFLPKMIKTLGNRCEDVEWCWDDVIRKGRDITANSLPQWLLDYERRGNVFDLAISKGIVLISFLQDRNENIAAAMGTEAYKVYMILLPLLRLHRDRVDLNGVDRNVLVAITPECEEDHLANNTNNMSIQSQFYPAMNDEDMEEPQDIAFPYASLEELSVGDDQCLWSCAEDMSKINDVKELEASYKAFYYSKEENFILDSRNVKV